MADLAIGFSKTVVEGIANQVKDAVKEEAEQWQIVERELVSITGEFEMMQSFLDVANQERVKNNVVRTWVRQVRDLSYDVEDCIEFVIHLDTKRGLGWLLRLGNRVQSWNCFKETPPRAIDRAVADIKQLKARVEDVSQRNLRYNLISDSGPKLATQHQSASHSLVSTATVDMFVKARETAGKHRGLVDITNLITKKGVDDLQVISVLGRGDHHGMMSIIKESYDEQGICQSFEFRAWVKVMHPFNHQEFTRSMWTQFSANLGHGAHDFQGELGEVFVRCQISSKQTYLVVLEDLCSMAEWHAVRAYLPDWKNGSRIVISTSQAEIARLCTGQPYRVSELIKFSAHNSVWVVYKDSSPKNPKGPQHNNHGTGASSLKEKGDHWLTNNPVVGRDLEVEKLFNLIISRDSSDKKPHVVSVWGVAGVGKSTLVQTVYYRCVKDGKFDLYGWVNVSHQFNLLNFSQSMLLSLRSESPHATDDIQECQNLLQKHRCLVVIDGLQSKEDWDLISARLIGGTSECCFAVVTADESVAIHCAATIDSLVFHVEGLGDEDAIVLFEKELRRNEIYVNPATEMEMRTLFLSKCGGLPAVLFSLSRYLATRPKDMLEQECRKLKASFMHELETKPQFGSLRSLLDWMQSYFRACPRSLKLCILYGSIFPENSVTRRSRLARRWIAEGYSRGTDTNTIVHYVEELFDQLAALSIVSQSTRERVTRSGCQINGFFREFIITRSMEEKIFLPLEISVLEGEGSTTIERVGQHLAIGSSWERHKVVFDSLDVSRLRSLTVYGEWKSFFISDRMRVLRVLDLENATEVEHKDLEKIGELLDRLKFLSLRGCIKINKLPDSFGNLKQLQTLDIRYTCVVRLPPSILKLGKLQFIRAGTAPLNDEDPSAHSRRILGTSVSSLRLSSHTSVGFGVGVEVPCAIGEMKELHTIGVINVGLSCESVIKDIRSLSQLRRLGVFGINKRNNEEFSSAISDHGNLECLSVWGAKMPQGVSSLFNLKKLSLGMNELLTQLDIEVLESLKRLQTLRLQVKKVENDDLNFFVRIIGISPSVPFVEMKSLQIACKSRLRVEFGEGAMGKLELLKVDCSYGSSLEFQGLEHTSSLKQVLLKGRCENALMVALKKQLDTHRLKPVLKQE